MKGYHRIRRSILAVLVAVFAGFILLLLGSAFVGLQAMRSIEQGAVPLVEEQRESSSLIDDIQQIEYDLDAIFYSLTTGASPEERRDLLVTLATLEQQIEGVNTTLARYETIKKFVMATDEATMNGGYFAVAVQSVEAPNAKRDQ